MRTPFLICAGIHLPICLMPNDGSRMRGLGSSEPIVVVVLPGGSL